MVRTLSKEAVNAKGEEVPLEVLDAVDERLYRIFPGYYLILSLPFIFLLTTLASPNM